MKFLIRFLDYDSRSRSCSQHTAYPPLATPRRIFKSVATEKIRELPSSPRMLGSSSHLRNDEQLAVKSRGK